MSKTDIKTLRQAVKDAEAKAKEADELVRSVRARLSEVQRDAMDANKALYDAQIALKAAGPLGKRLTDGMNAAITKYGIPAHTIDLGAKGCVSYRSEPLTNYRDFLETNTDLYLASYPWMINRGVFMTPGDVSNL